VQYTTTIHVLNSAIIKLSREQQVVHAIDITNIANTHAFHSRFYEIQACRVYRGVSGGMLPREFWFKNEYGIRGGVELAFMSTTTNRDVAICYSKPSNEETCSMVFEIQMGMVDRGAEMSWVSQFPEEVEILFPPLTTIEIVDEPRVEVTSLGRVIFVPLRLSCNQSNTATVEEAMNRQRKAHLLFLKELMYEFRSQKVPESCLREMEKNLVRVEILHARCIAC
jgi:hypothetical protein